MDYKCPMCGGDLGRRKLSRAVVARMEIDCDHCKERICLNVHQAEVMIIFLHFAAFVVLACLAYWLKSQNLALIALGVAVAGALILSLFEYLYLRDWPRYATVARRPAPEQ